MAMEIPNRGAHGNNIYKWGILYFAMFEDRRVQAGWNHQKIFPLEKLPRPVGSLPEIWHP